MARALLRCLPLVVLFSTRWAVADEAGPEDPIREFEDRHEGILERREVVPGEKITLYAARIESDEPVPGDEASPFRIAFWMPDSGRADVLVRNFATLYQMQPRQQEFPPGVWRFSWPAEIASRHGLGLDDLRPLVLHRPRVGRNVSPALIYRERPVISDVRYVFSLWARVPVTLLEWEFRNEEFETVHSGTLRGIPRDQPFEVTWSPKNEEGEPAPAGEYSFFVRTSFQPQPGTPGRKVIQKYVFHHGPELLESLRTTE